jgi:hypothetical protein
MDNSLKLTRYLYIKDEVELTLITSILNNDDSALFWAYELYYSGFTSELTNLFWTLYYDFYATLNPTFEKYLLNKLKNNLKTKEAEGDKLVGTIVSNFMIRQHSSDVFFMKEIVKTCEFDTSSLLSYSQTKDILTVKKELIGLLENEDFLTLSYFILQEMLESDGMKMFEIFLEYFIEKKSMKGDINNCKKEMNKMMLLFPNRKRFMLLCKILYFINVMKNKKIGKSMYIYVDDSDVVMYETIVCDLKEKGNGSKSPILPAYKILPIASLFEIDKDNYLSLFHLKREKINLMEIYYYDWLFYCSLTPIWRQRIHAFGGIVNNFKKKIEFEEVEMEEKFWEEFNYEPDEQKKDVQLKSIKDIEKKRNWVDFYKIHNKNGILEIEEEILQDLNKITYL